MGQYADDAIDAGMDETWGWRSRGWRAPVSQMPATSASASDFADLTAPVADPFWTAAENYAQAYKDYYSYMCDASYADLQVAIEALEAAR